MRMKLLAVAFLVMLAALTAGIASADMNADSALNSGAGIVPLSSAVDAKKTQVFWNAGTFGYLHQYDPGSTLVKRTTDLYIGIPADSWGQVGTPFALPTRINGQPTSVRYLYLQWSGPAYANITDLELRSGSSAIGTNPHAVNSQGTGSPQTITVDLQAWYSIPNGLGASWVITNSYGNPITNNITGYGAKIRYAG